MSLCGVCGLYPAQFEAEGNSEEVFCHQDCVEFAYDPNVVPEGINASYLSASKARKILSDGTVHGRPLTARQRRYFGWVAGGRRQRRRGGRRRSRSRSRGRK